MPEVQHSRRLVRFGAFALDPVTGELHNAGTTIRLQPQPLKVLLAILNSPGELVSREQLKNELLPDALYGDPDHAINLAVTKLRSALQDSAEQPHFIETLPRRGYRFIAPVEPPIDSGIVLVAGADAPIPSPKPEQEARSTDEKEAAVDPQGSGAAAGVRKIKTFKWIAAAVMVGASVAALFFLFLPFHSAGLSDRDTVVLAAFTNMTGDPMFDNTLRHGLSAHLQQSPFINLLSDERIAQELSLMTQPRGTQLTNELANELCQRTGSAATIQGSINRLGSEYVLHLSALNCHSGDLLAEEQVTADGKEQVLKSLGLAATNLRAKLGERLPSIQAHAAPSEDVTTPSLEALRAYSLGIEAINIRNDYTAAVMLFKQAISLDQSFAMAYAELGTAYMNLGQTERGADNIRKAYTLRERVSGREKLYIESHYAQLVQGNLEAARKIYTSWIQLYPRDVTPITNLAVIYMTLGYYDKTIPLHKEALRREPGSGIAYVGLVWALVYVGRLDEAKAIAQEAVARADTPELHRRLYKINFLKRDAPGMESELSNLRGVPGYSDIALSTEADTASYFGQFAKARALTRRAADTAILADEPETAAAHYATAAVREALVGNSKQAKQQAQAALLFANSRYVEAESAIALALAGESSRAQQLVDDLAQRFPEDTVIQFNLLPSIRSAMALRSGDGSNAVEVLVPAEPYDLATSLVLVNYYPVYFRGQAYLATHQGASAAAEFQKIHDHRGVVANTPLGSLAHLGTGRAYALIGDTVKARAAYQEFLTLWKDADPDTPLLKEAKAEYARLQVTPE